MTSWEVQLFNIVSTSKKKKRKKSQKLNLVVNLSYFYLFCELSGDACNLFLEDLGSRGCYQLLQHIYIYTHIIYIYAAFFVTDNELQKIPIEAASLREIAFRQLH